MRNQIALALVFLAVVSTAMGKTKPTITPTPTQTLVSTLSPTPTPRPAWVQPPSVDRDSKSVNATIALHYSDDVNGSKAYSLFDLSAVRKLDENDVSAQGTVRFEKPASGSDDVESLELREANISLSEPWFEARAGRMDLSDLVTTTHFFGLYPLMGQRRLDGIKIYIPFKFFFGVEDYKSVSSPPTSLSFFYFPSFFSSQNSAIDGSQGFFMGQARMKLDFGDLRTVLLFNLGAGSNDWFYYGSLSGNPTYSICGEATLNKNNSLYFEYGVLNAADTADTNVFAFGGKLQHLFTWEFLSLDEVILEVQLPLGTNPNDPFTGGNGIDPSLAGLAQTAWYGKARVRIRSIFIDFNITNSQNDYTLARLNTYNINTPLPLPVGRGNETDGLETTLSSSGYGNIAFSVDMGVPF